MAAAPSEGNRPPTEATIDDSADPDFTPLASDEGLAPETPVANIGNGHLNPRSPNNSADREPSMTELAVSTVDSNANHATGTSPTSTGGGRTFENVGSTNGTDSGGRLGPRELTTKSPEDLDTLSVSDLSPGGGASKPTPPCGALSSERSSLGQHRRWIPQRRMVKAHPRR